MTTEQDSQDTKSVGGRPTKYKAEYADQAYKLCLLGATDGEMADFFYVTESTLNLWKQAHPLFSESMTRGKTIADAEVAEKLFNRAKGYSHDAVKIFNNNGSEMVVPYTEHYPPDTQAASLWLRNRQPKKWRDNKNIDHSSTDGSMSPPTTITLVAMSGADGDE